MRLTRRFHFLTAVLLLMAGAVTAQEPAPLSDEQIRQLIEQKLQAKKLLKDSFDVSVETGVVHSEVERVKAERIANSTFGVLSVENLLRLDR